MRPNSIIMFERLFLASLAVGLLVFVIGYDEMMAALGAEPAFRQAGIGGGVVIGLVAVVYALYLLLGYLVARRAVNAAKWILVVITVLDVLAALPTLAGPRDITLLLGLAARVLAIAAMVYLFRPDAVAWLKGEKQVEPTTFD